MATWILTGSLENFRINVERGFDVIGFKERRRNQAREIEPGDEIVFYVTGVQAFGGIARVRSEMFEDRAPIWPQGKKKHPEPYPWRVDAEPVVVLDEEEFVPAESLVGELEHISASGRPSTGTSPSRGSCGRSVRRRRRAAAASGSAAPPASPAAAERDAADPRAPLHREEANAAICRGSTRCFSRLRDVNATG